MVNIFRAVIGMESFDDERELIKELFKDRDEESFGYFLGRRNDLELSDFIDRIDVVDAFNLI